MSHIAVFLIFRNLTFFFTFISISSWLTGLSDFKIFQWLGPVEAKCLESVLLALTLDTDAICIFA